MKPKLFKNPTKHDIDIPGFGIVPAGEVVSVTGSFLTQALLMDHAELLDITDESSEPEAPSE